MTTRWVGRRRAPGCRTFSSCRDRSTRAQRHGPIRARPIRESGALKSWGSARVRARGVRRGCGGVLPAAKYDRVLPSFMPGTPRTRCWRPRQRTRCRAGAAGRAARPPRNRTVGPSRRHARRHCRNARQILGRSVNVVEAPLDAIVPPFMSFGMSQHMSEISARCTRASSPAASRGREKGSGLAARSA